MKCETCIHKPLCIRITHTFGHTENCGYYLEEPKQGEWIDVNGDGSIMKCSKCGDEVCCKNNNFCPNCGARMKNDK